MRYILSTLFVFCLFPTLASAQDLDVCTAFSWDANTEPDMHHYDVYVSEDSNPAVSHEVLHPTRSISCSTMQLTVNHAYSMTVTATDTSGNESAPSNSLDFRIIPAIPGVPGNLCIDGTLNGAPIHFCLTP